MWSDLVKPVRTFRLPCGGRAAAPIGSWGGIARRGVPIPAGAIPVHACDRWRSAAVASIRLDCAQAGVQQETRGITAQFRVVLR